jgi:hypothetical protein
VLDYVNGPDAKTPAGLAEARKEFSAVVNRLCQRAGASRGQQVWKP